MEACFASFNTKGFASSLSSYELPSHTHLTYGGLFNELNYTIGPKAQKGLEIHTGYARAQNPHSCFDPEVNNYLALFTKGAKDGEERDHRILNSVVVLDISGSMGSGLTSKGQGCRIQLAKQAILMFFSKLRPTDSFGLVVFNNTAQTLIPVRRVEQLTPEEVSSTVAKIKAGGGTTLLSGLAEANNQLREHLETIQESTDMENRLVMLTDVEDNSIESAGGFIRKVQAINIHTTVIGISDSFKSQVCEDLREVSGFNYLCATEVGDLRKYLFANFSFTFFPSNYDINITIQSQQIRSIEVFGTADAEKVPIYNAAATNSFTVTKTKTSFPSELEITGEGIVKTHGGLVLVKLRLKDQNSTTFTADIKLEYRNVDGQNCSQQYPIRYESPLNEQYYSDECLQEALSAFFYAYEAKNILQAKDSKEATHPQENSRYIKGLEKMRETVPKSKIEELNNLIKTLKCQENDVKSM